MITINEVKARLLQNDNIYILTHQHPDGDTLGSGFALCKALQKLGKKAKVIIDGDLTDKYKYLANGIIEQDFESNYVVSVDVADIKLLGENKDIFEGIIDMAIDHHISHKQFAKEYFVDSNAGANAQIIYRIIDKLGVEFDSDIANSIFTGICTDTGCFKYPNASPESFRIAAKMIESGADSASISREMFDTKSRQRVALECETLMNIEYFCNDKASMITITQELLNKTGANDDDIEGLSALPRQITGVKVGVMVRERKTSGYKVSVRTTGEYSASNICAMFDGGGHKAAGGCVIEGTLEETQKLIKKAVEDEILNN